MRSGFDDAEHAVECDCLEQRTLTATALEDLLRDAEFECEDCGEDLRLASGELVLACTVCDMTFEASSLAEARAILDEGCGSCSRNEFDADTIHVPGSFHDASSEYEWVRAGKSSVELVRKGRLDYWEGVIHFCEPDAFVSIVTSRVIRGSETGRFGLPAVCLTEVPASSWAELRDAHGQFGFVFTKHDVIRMGGGPVLYLPDHLIKVQQWHDDVAPFVQLLREPAAGHTGRQFNFLHEREWRVPSDINLDATPPHAVVRGRLSGRQRHWREILEALQEFGELETG